MAQRKLRFTKKEIALDTSNLVGGKQVRTVYVDVKETNFTFKSYNHEPNKPENIWEVSTIYFEFWARENLYNLLCKNSNFELTVDESNIAVRDGLSAGKNFYISNSGKVECFFPLNDDKIKLTLLDLVDARDDAINQVKSHWNSFTELNNQNIKQVLGNDWENNFSDKKTQDEIDIQRGELLTKISDALQKTKKKIIFSKKNVEKFSPFPRDSKIKGLRINLEKEFENGVYYPGDGGGGGEHEKVGLESKINSDSLKVYNYQRLAEIWEKGQVTLKKTNSKQPDPEDTPNHNDLKNLLERACSQNSSNQDKIAALKIK